MLYIAAIFVVLFAVYLGFKDRADLQFPRAVDYPNGFAAKITSDEFIEAWNSRPQTK